MPKSCWAAKSMAQPVSGTVTLTACMLAGNGYSSQRVGTVTSSATAENHRKLRQPYWRTYTGTIAATKAVYASLIHSGIIRVRGRPCNPATRAAARLRSFRSGTVIGLLGTLLLHRFLLRTFVPDEFALAADFGIERRIGCGRRIDTGPSDFVLPAFASSYVVVLAICGGCVAVVICHLLLLAVSPLHVARHS